VRIDVAVDAFRELHVLVANRAAGRIRLVAFLARNLDVLASQEKARLGVIKLFGGLPIGEVVALQAVVTELALVRIFVAGDAILRKPKEGLGEILHFDESALVSHHIHRRVASFASDAGVFSFEDVAGKPVIELFLRALPMDKSKVLAVVLEMAADAVFPIGIVHLNLKVVAVLRGQPPGDFLVAIETLESGSAGTKYVAACALRSAAQRLVGFGKRAGGNLRTRG